MDVERNTAKRTSAAARPTLACGTAAVLFALTTAARAQVQETVPPSAPVHQQAAVATAAVTTATATATGAATADDKAGDLTGPEFERFLDRIMMAESGGRDDLRSTTSTASGPYQLIVGMFKEVSQRHFPSEIAGLDQEAWLALRFNRDFARKIAAAFTRENAAALQAAGHTPTYARLRLAYLLGANGAIRLLGLPGEQPLTIAMSQQVLRANPFMTRLTVAGLVARTAREVSDGIDEQRALRAPAGLPVGVGKPQGPRIAIACDLDRPSCRKWLALAKVRVKGPKLARPTRTAAAGS